MTLVKNYSYLLCVFGFVSLLAFIIFCIPVTKLIVKGMKYDNDVEELHEEIDSLRGEFNEVSEKMADKIVKLMKAHRKDSKNISTILEEHADLWGYVADLSCIITNDDICVDDDNDDIYVDDDNDDIKDT